MRNLEAYYAKSRTIVENLNTITSAMLEKDIFCTVLKDYITTNSFRINGVPKYFTFVNCTVCSAMSVYLYIRRYILHSYDLIFPAPYDIHSFPGLYDLTPFGQAMAIVFGSIKQSSLLCLLFSIILHLGFCLKQLKFSCERLFQDSVNETQTDDMKGQTVHTNLQKRLMFKGWIQGHGTILR